MSRAPRASGFTIVETMVVLAVTGLLFVVAAFYISGRQRTTQYQTDQQDLHSQIQKVLNDVQNGTYPDAGTLPCSKGIGGTLFFGLGNKSQGTNQGCVFLGKSIEFSSDATQSINVYTIAGVNTAITTDGTAHAVPTPHDIVSLANYRNTIEPTVARQSVTSLVNEPFSENGLQLVKMTYGAGLSTCTPTTVAYCGVAFLSDTGSVSSGGQIQNGNSHVAVYPVFSQVIFTGTHLNMTLPPTTGQSIKLYFKSLNINQCTILTIGNNGSTDITSESKDQVGGTCG